jgi:hypothetical protein
MITKRKGDDSKKFMVSCYYSSNDSYLISPLKEEEEEKDGGDDNDDEPGIIADEQAAAAAADEETKETPDLTTQATQQQLKQFSRMSLLSPTQLHSASTFSNEEEGEIASSMELEQAPSAKFYPLIHELMRRGDQTAAVTSGFLHQPEVSHLVTKTTSLVESSAQSAKGKLNEETLGVLTTSVEGAVPKDEEVKQLIHMLKDEELTVLLEKGRERLQQLVSKDIPKATALALQKTGIRVVSETEDADSPYMNAIVKSRQAALTALEDVLKQAEVDSDLEKLRGSLGENFTTMFDSLAQASKTDRTLSSIFDTVSGKTVEWQEATGRLMSTRSASLFLEGASRIQARAANLFSKDQLQWAGEIGSKFTKAFTEGDAAVARLKSIELGDVVRDRLVEAIEVRSESLGGLDGIIAGALTSFKQGSSGSGDQMSNMLASLQGKASSFTKGANETLISVLARRSEYRDVALLKVEQVLCDLESQFGKNLSPEDIAAIARGEGGTAKLFEPIAKRAAKEIEKQLDAAEASVSDPTIVEVLKHVRKIVSGELTLGAVMDEVVNILNDDKVVEAGENLMKHGEQVLDAIEGVSGNKVVDDVFHMAEKAGFTKDAVMSGIEKLDVNTLLDTAGNAITDEKARSALLSSATDTALDFILRILPSMPVPPFDGVKDGLVYQISNLSMEGFKVKKDNIVVEIAGMRATKKGKPPKNTMSSESGHASFESDPGVQDNDSLAISRTASTDSDARSRTESADSSIMEMEMDTSWSNEGQAVKATELLTIDVREISAVFNDAVWSFEQTYLPYLKGGGKVDVNMSNGAIRLVFELRRRRKEGVDRSKAGEFDASEWVPVLCLHDRSFSIGAVELTMQGGGRLAWVVNKLAVVFKGALRDYVVRTILDILTDKSGWILAKLNEGLGSYWDLVLRTAKLNMQELEEAGIEDIVAAKPAESKNLIELVWRDPIPLGMNLLLNDESGQLKVVDFPRGSQARSVCEKRNLNPEGLKGAAIVAVNGIRYASDDDLFDALREPGRPKTILFQLAESEEAERIRKFVEESQDSEAPEKPQYKERTFQTRNVEFVENCELGIEFANAPDNFGLVVRTFIEGEDGIVLAAQRHQDIHVGDLLTHINGEAVVGEDGKGRARAMELLGTVGSKRPLSLTFADPYLFRTVFERPTVVPTAIGGPAELVLEEKKLADSDTRRITIQGFDEVDGFAETCGILLGDHLVFVNGISVGAGVRWLDEPVAPSMEQVMHMIRDKASYPIGLTFARPKQLQHQSYTSYFVSSPKTSDAFGDAFGMDAAQTICVTAEKYEQLGCILEMCSNGDIVVNDLTAVSGPFQAMMKNLKDEQSGRFHLSIESVNGQFVPGYASPQLAKSAMDRSWKSENRVELILCDDERKEWIHSLSKKDGA